MQTKTPEIKLISCSRYPVETLFAAWAQSRPTKYPALFAWLKDTRGSSVVTAQDVHDVVYTPGEGFEHVLTKEDLFDVIKDVSALDLPITEAIQFTWGFSNLPIEWREQAVRKRQWGFWLTSMREFGMSDFAEDGRYCPPPDGSVTVESMSRFHEMIHTIQGFYRELQGMGWTQEKARKVIPLSATHNGTLFSTFRTMVSTLEARSCWIAQLDIWAPVITGMIKELRDKVHPMFGRLVTPPCFKRHSNEFVGCKYELINSNRIEGTDPYAPCPLYDIGGDWEDNCALVSVSARKDAQRLLPIWGEIWDRDPMTGRLRE